MQTAEHQQVVATPLHKGAGPCFQYGTTEPALSVDVFTKLYVISIKFIFNSAMKCIKIPPKNRKRERSHTLKSVYVQKKCCAWLFNPSCAPALERQLLFLERLVG